MKVFCGISLRDILHEVLMNLIHNVFRDYTLKLQQFLPAANELSTTKDIPYFALAGELWGRLLWIF